MSGVLENWATYVNRFSERSIRLQKARHQTVVTNGPYAIVRHPGYLSCILRFTALPLGLGSVYTILPIAAGILVIAIRANVEYALLTRNLPGYREYARNVKYRLFPLVWYVVSRSAAAPVRGHRVDVRRPAPDDLREARLRDAGFLFVKREAGTSMGSGRSCESTGAIAGRSGCSAGVHTNGALRSR